MTKEEILALATDDYQHRKGDYPASGEADTIDVYEKSDNTFEIEASFKNTSEDRAKRWIERFAEKNDLKIVKTADACQDGDYHDDWVRAWVIVKGDKN